MTFEQLMQEPEHLLLKCISGSRANNLALQTSDTDLKGIFVPPPKGVIWAQLHVVSFTVIH
jgi:predicted nucleotidyltransferase